VRDLFVDYLHERAPGLDYSSLVALVSKIVRLFWRDLEIHEPGIDSLHLSDDVARRWKRRLSEVRHGRQRIGAPRQDLAANLMAVRAFYADLTHWALEDPARWAGWGTLPGTSEVIPLRQVAPSKTDRERLLVVSPELSEALAAIVARVRGGHEHIPLVSRYDGSERLHRPALPFLCQRPSGARQQPFTSMFVKQLLDRVVKINPILAADGKALRFTPHDFRRIFATDAAAAGLPVHILAKILGHETVATTQIYVAIYDQDVIDRHRGFIARRRTIRSSEEYREPTDAEWASSSDISPSARWNSVPADGRTELVVNMSTLVLGARCCVPIRPSSIGSLRSSPTFMNGSQRRLSGAGSARSRV
jgi:integrase